MGRMKALGYGRPRIPPRGRIEGDRAPPGHRSVHHPPEWPPPVGAGNGSCCVCSATSSVVQACPWPVACPLLSPPPRRKCGAAVASISDAPAPWRPTSGWWSSPGSAGLPCFPWESFWTVWGLWEARPKQITNWLPRPTGCLEKILTRHRKDALQRGNRANWSVRHGPPAPDYQLSVLNCRNLL